MSKETDDHPILASNRREDAEDGVTPTDEQAAALELSRNIAVTAGAGTGKTLTLTLRYLEMLELEDVSPENIITITFTKDAANEMRERIRGAVDENLSAAETQAEYDEWRAIRDELEDGYIHTIHAFCSRLLTEHAVEAPVDPNFETLDETDAAQLQRTVVTEFIDERQDTRDVELLARLWSRHELEEVLVGLLDSRPESSRWASYWEEASPDDYLDVTWNQFIPIDPETVEAWFADSDFMTALTTLQELHARELDIDAGDAALGKIQEIDAILERTGALSEAASTRSRQTAVNAIADELTTGAGDRYSSDYQYYGANTNGWPDFEAQREQLRGAMDMLLETLEPETLSIIEDLSTERNSSYYVIALARLYADLESAYTETKADRRALDYSDLIEKTIAFLHEHDAARSAIQQQFDYIMVDEVQDTDPRQWRLVRALTGSDPTQIDSRNVFLVGDEKQSIYRFRGADVTAFGEARRRLSAANPPDKPADLPLSGNFRTLEPTLQFINDLFDDVFQPEGDDRQPYEAIPQRLTAERDEGTEIEGSCEYLVVPNSDQTDLLPSTHPLNEQQFISAAHREATALAARLTQLFADPPQVYDEEEERYRAAEPRDVTILLRARTRLEYYERALDDEEIPYTVVSGMGFYDTPEITALLNVLRVLEDPTNDIALYGVLRSPLFGVTDDEVAKAVADSAAPPSLWEAIAESDDSLGDAYTLLRSWRAATGLSDATTDGNAVSSWSSLVTRIIQETGYLASVSADDRPQQAVVNIEKLREQFRDWEDQRALSVSALLDKIDQQRELSKRTPEATIHTETEGIEIRTVHSAKGLESRIVVVPELNSGFNQGANVDEYGKVYLDEVDDVPFLGLKAPTRADPFTKKDTLVRDRLQAQHRREDRAEQKRLLYVAMTRVRDHLILSGTNDFTVVEDEVFAKQSNPDDASTWRDFVEATIFDAIDVAQFLKQDIITGELEHSEFRVRLPPEPTDWGGTASRSPKNPPSIDIPSPDRPPQPARLSATDFAKHVTGHEGDTDFDVGEPDPSRGDETQSGVESDGEATAREDTVDDDSEPVEYADLAAAFGEAVHRICELDRPEAEWDAIIADAYDEQGIDLSHANLDEIRTHARRGLSAVETLESEVSEPISYNELFVRVNLEGGLLIGFIDHLVVANDAIYILDFKTSDTSERSPAELAERYWPQLKAYAVAIGQSEISGREIHAVLYFTDVDTLERRQISSEELANTKTTIEEILRDGANS